MHPNEGEGVDNVHEYDSSEPSGDDLQWFQTHFRNHSDKQFVHAVRMSRSSFTCLLILVKASPLLRSKGTKPVMGICRQLALCLRRLGSMETCQAIALQFDISAGSVISITERIRRALIGVLLPIAGLWMTPDERACARAAFLRLTGFDGVVGAIDGTHIAFLQRPKADDADAMYTYKKRYAVAVQGVADHKLRIRNYFICHTASAHDAGIFAASPIGRDSSLFFRLGNSFLVMLPIHAGQTGEKLFHQAS